MIVPSGAISPTTWLPVEISGAIDSPLMNASGAITATDPGNASGRKPSGRATAQRG